MNLLQALKRAVRRFNGAAEETALAASVLSDGGRSPQVNATGLTTVLGEIEKDEREAQE